MSSYTVVKHSLVYQKDALEHLYRHLRATFHCLCLGRPERLEELEKRIIRITGNAFEDRVETNRMLGGRTISEFIAQELQPEERTELFMLSTEIEVLEGACRRQAQQNSAMAVQLERETLRSLEEAIDTFSEAYGLDETLFGMDFVSNNEAVRVQ